MIAACRDEYEHVEDWLKSGGSPNALTAHRDGFTLLTAAAQHCCLKIIDLVVRYGGDVTLPERSGKTPLFYAAEAGERVAVQRLIRAHALVNAQSNSGHTALMLASTANHTTVVEQLLRSHADATLRNQEGLTAADLAALSSPHCAELLRDHSLAPLTPYSAMPQATLPEAILWAAAAGDLRTVGAWLTQPHSHVDARGRDVDPDLEGNCLLHAAAQEGQEAVVRALVQRQATVDLAGDDGETALIVAAEYGHTSTVRLLLHHRACPDQQGSCEWPGALLSASCEGHRAIVALLLEHAASVDLPHPRGHVLNTDDFEGSTAL